MVSVSPPHCSTHLVLVISVGGAGTVPGSRGGVVAGAGAGVARAGGGVGGGGSSVAVPDKTQFLDGLAGRERPDLPSPVAGPSHRVHHVKQSQPEKQLEQH